MSISRKTLVGGVVGVVAAIGLIVAGMYAFGGGNLLGGSSTTGIISSSTSTTGLGSSSGTSSGTSTSGSGSSGGMGTLQLAMIDPPHVPPNVVSVYINYSEIQVHIANAGNNSGWYNVTSSGTLNLTKIVNASKILGTVSLPNGTYNIVRFNVTSAVVTINGTTGKLSNSTARVPSGMVQAVITGGVNVRPNTTSALLVDISPTVTGANGSYVLVPSITAHPTTPVANSLTTTVTQSKHTTTSVSTTSHTSS